MTMGIGVSLILIAVGAILRFASTASVTGFNIQTIGVILMVVGVIGFIASCVYWGSWGGFGGMSRRRTTISRSGNSYDAVGSPYDGTQRATEVVTRVDEERVG
jgi:hypothetical protein